jgi:hypothetical protein
VWGVLAGQTDSTYVVPALASEVTSWSTQAGADGGLMALVIFRAAGAGSYTVVGVSPVESLTVGTLNFTLASPISVQAGDFLGMYESGADCIFGATGSVSGAMVPGVPTVGATFTPSFTSSFRANISATLNSLAPPAMPTSKNDCKNGGWQTFGGKFKNQGDCVSYVATGGRNGPAA